MNPEMGPRESEEEKLEYDPKIVAHNLNMLNKDMVKLLLIESIGGNADSVEIEGKRYLCGGANGYANKNNGEIIIFGNIQDVGKNTKDNTDNSDFTLRVALDSKSAGFFKIVDFFESENFTKEGKQNIEIAIKQYNAMRKDPKRSK